MVESLIAKPNKSMNGQNFERNKSVNDLEFDYETL